MGNIKAEYIKNGEVFFIGAKTRPLRITRITGDVELLYVKNGKAKTDLLIFIIGQ